MTKVITGVLIIAAGLILSALIMALPVMWLWNGVGVDVLGLQAIGFWQAMGLTLLARFLFGTGSGSSN